MKSCAKSRSKKNVTSINLLFFPPKFHYSFKDFDSLCSLMHLQPQPRERLFLRSIWSLKLALLLSPINGHYSRVRWSFEVWEPDLLLLLEDDPYADAGGPFELNK